MSQLKESDRVRYNILFESISDEDFCTLHTKLRERRYSAQEIIVEDESEGDELFLLVEGRVKIVKKTRAGDEKLLAVLHPGDFFGELELVDGRHRSARVVALEDCVVHLLSREDFDRLLWTSHPFAIRLMQVVSVRLRASNQHFIAELERSARRAGAQVKRLEQLIEASKALNTILDLDKLLDIILETALSIVDGDSGTVYLIDEEKQELWSKVLRGTEVITIRLPMGKGIAGYVAATGDTLNIQDAYIDPRFNPDVDRKSGYHTQTILCVPMKNIDGKIIGVFQLLNKHTGFFTHDDESIIAALSIHAAIAIEKAWLYEEEKAYLRMQEEVRLAARIQSDLLPKSIPKIPGYDVVGTSIPARQVGGDYFDFIGIDETHWALCLGDVSGKGLPASLLMANVQATLRGQTLLHGSPKDCIQRANTLLCESTSSDKFVTLFYSILDSKQHLLKYTNAGHDQPYLISRAKTEQRLETGGIVLGIMNEFSFEEASVSLQPGDVLLIYSDGIVESMNEHEELFGEQRLLGAVRQCTHLPSRNIMERIIGAVHEFTGAHPQWDDMTLMIVKRNED